MKRLLASIAAPVLFVAFWAMPASAHTYGPTTTCPTTTTTTQPTTTTTVEQATTTTAAETTSTTQLAGETSTVPSTTLAVETTTSFPENHPGGGEDRPTSTLGPVSTAGATPNADRSGELPHTGTGPGPLIFGAFSLVAGLALLGGKHYSER